MQLGNQKKTIELLRVLMFVDVGFFFFAIDMIGKKKWYSIKSIYPHTGLNEIQ